jgi:phage terminase large subunit-like protein
VAIVAATFGDGRDICVEGESGLQAICPDLEWNRSLGQCRFPSGCRGQVYSGAEPDRLRGPNNYAYWADELCSWQYPAETWDQLIFTVRKGRAHGVVTTTPRPIPLLKRLLGLPSTVVTRGHTDENRANLSPAYIQTIVARYEGTRLGRQELAAELLEDAEGALWTRALLEANRVTRPPAMPRIVVALDPSVQSEGQGDACGIVVAGLGTDGHGYVLDDLTLHGSPHAWATAAVAAYHKWHADALVAEANNGGALVQVNIGTIPDAPSVKLVHASRGKHTRAEPIANLDEQGRIHHVGVFPALEDELCGWEPETTTASPNRLDARVWACTDLQIRPGAAGTLVIAAPAQPSSVRTRPHAAEEDEMAPLHYLRGEAW